MFVRSASYRILPVSGQSDCLVPGIDLLVLGDLDDHDDDDDDDDH